MVYTRSVGEEILVYGEANLEWTVLHEAVLCISYRSVGNSGARFCLVLGERLARIVTLARARWNKARSRFVWQALVSYNTGVLQVVPCIGEVSTLASIVRGITRNHILWGEDWERTVVLCDAVTVSQGLRCTESPARTTLLLIANRVSTLWPVLVSIEGGWYLVGGDTVGELWKSHGLWVYQECTEHVLYLGHLLALEDLILASSPLSSVVRVNTGDDSLVQYEWIRENCCDDCEECYERKYLDRKSVV